MKADIKDILIQEYEKLWTYYQNGINEMFKLFDWYFKIVTIPSIVIPGLFYFSENNKLNIDLKYLGLVYFVIFICGLSIYITYT